MYYLDPEERTQTMTDHNQDQATETEKAPASATAITTLEVARKNSRMAAAAAALSSILTLIAVAVVIVIDVNYGKVAAVPVGNVWDLPVVGKIYVPSRIEENAKPLHVALRYIRNFYEVDLTDFVQIGADPEATGGPVMVSTKTTQLLPYAIPGTDEYTNVLKTIEYSSINYRLFNESKCWRRFLVDSVEMSDSISGTKRVDAVGRFIISCDDNTKPVPAQNLGTKMISLYLMKGSPTLLKDKVETDRKAADASPDDARDSVVKGGGVSTAEVAALNPEGWFVVKNIVTPLSESELTLLQEMRRKQGIKPAK